MTKKDGTWPYNSYKGQVAYGTDLSDRIGLDTVDLLIDLSGRTEQARFWRADLSDKTGQARSHSTYLSDRIGPARSYRTDTCMLDRTGQVGTDWLTRHICERGHSSSYRTYVSDRTGQNRTG